MSSLTIGVAQTVPLAGEVEKNLAEHLRLISVAAGHGADLVVFPELSLTGYELGLAERCAFSETDLRLAPLADAARTSGAVLVVGAPVRLGPKLHIGAFILQPDGARFLYTKRHLGAFGPGAACDGTPPPPEASVFQAGERDPLFAVGAERAAVAICADTGRPSHVQQASSRAATIYVASMFVIPSELDQDAARLQRYARDHRLVVAMSNFGGATGGLAAGGQSAIWSADGVLRARLPGEGAGVALATREGESWRSVVIPLAKA